MASCSESRICMHAAQFVNVLYLTRLRIVCPMCHIHNRYRRRRLGSGTKAKLAANCIDLENMQDSLQSGRSAGPSWFSR